MRIFGLRNEEGGDLRIFSIIITIINVIIKQVMVL